MRNGLIAASILALLFATMANAQDRPKTNGERGMLRFDEAFGQNPKIKLCEVAEDGKVRLRDCPEQDKCLSPDCSWLNTKNGDLTATRLPGPNDKAYHWRGWALYKYQVRKICSRPGNTCTKDTRRWLAAGSELTAAGQVIQPAPVAAPKAGK